MTTTTITGSALEVGDRIYTPPAEALALSFDGPGKRVTIPASWFTVEAIEYKTVARTPYVYITGTKDGRTKTFRKSLPAAAKMEVAR